MSLAPITPKTTTFVSQIPKEILENPAIISAISLLPSHYNFEIHKSIWRILDMSKQLKKSKILVGLQFPEGLLMFSTLIADILENFTGCECIILGDVTYGACCIDDLSIKELQGDFLIHYGHSCLVPINETAVKTLYVFVEIKMDLQHFIQTFELNFPQKSEKLFLLGTIQFNSMIFEAKATLEAKGYTSLIISQEKPRSAGEVLGCTAPVLEEKAIVIFICDGRFHMEAVMIRNPTASFFQYNPYTKKLTIETYDNEKMMELRKKAIEISRKGKRVCVIFGVLGRQGNTHILERLESNLREKNMEYTVLLNSEINVAQLTLLDKYNSIKQIK